MESDLNKKLSGWERDDRIEEAENTYAGTIVRLRVLNSRLDMLLGSAITAIFFGVCLFILHIGGVT